MTPVEIAAALAVQAAVLDRLARQLEAVEAALVRPEAAVSEAAGDERGEGTSETSEGVAANTGERAATIHGGRSPIGRSFEHARASDSRPARIDEGDEIDGGEEDDEGWTTLVEAGELPSIDDDDDAADSTRLARARAPLSSLGSPRDAVVDRWSAPMRPPASRESTSHLRARGPASGEPLDSLQPTLRSAPEFERPASVTTASASEPGASEPGVDRWSRPLRPIGPGRREGGEPIASAPSRSASSGSSRVATDMPATDMPAAERRESLATVRQHAPLDRGGLAIERAPINLPAPLRLPHAHAGELEFEPIEPARESEAPRGFDPWSRAATPEPGRLARARAGLESRRAIEREPAPEPSLDDEFDELARLEERMADVLERVLLEIGVEP
ncbi:hypothetical protein ACNOYE_28260 [Nannocystaceae bacterium ST9]